MGAYISYNLLENNLEELISIQVSKRYDNSRSFFISSFSNGKLSKVDPITLEKITEHINSTLPKSIENEVIIGICDKSVVLASFLAQKRNSMLINSTRAMNEDFKSAIKFKSSNENAEPTQFVYDLDQSNDVIIITDTIIVGQEIINLCKGLIEANVNIVGISCLIEITNFNARKKIKDLTNIEIQSIAKLELTP